MSSFSWLLPLGLTVLVAGAAVSRSTSEKLSPEQEAQVMGQGMWSGKACSFLQTSCNMNGVFLGMACQPLNSVNVVCDKPKRSETCNPSLMSNECVGDINQVACDAGIDVICQLGVNGAVWVENPVPPPDPASCGVWRKCV